MKEKIEVNKEPQEKIYFVDKLDMTVLNYVHNSIYPVTKLCFGVVISMFFVLRLAEIDASCGLAPRIEVFLQRSRWMHGEIGVYLATVMAATIIWMIYVKLLRMLISRLLTYTGWMFEPKDNLSKKTKIWMLVLRLLMGTRKPQLYNCQSLLPLQPVGSLDQRIRDIVEEKRIEWADNEHMFGMLLKCANDFKKGLGKRLHFSLKTRAFLLDNYFTDWWITNQYFRTREPSFLVNKNYFGMESPFYVPTRIQAARAANLTYAMLMFKDKLDQETYNPQMLLNGLVPLCSDQFKSFHSTRIPGKIEDSCLISNSSYIVVYHKGRYFKMYVLCKDRYLLPCELEIAFQSILDDEHPPSPGEELLASLTAGNRDIWFEIREKYFSMGLNKKSMNTLEKAVTVVVLDDREYDDFHLDKPDFEILTKRSKDLLHGSGHDRWFDKSYNIIVAKDGKYGVCFEHSWGDANVSTQIIDHTYPVDVYTLGYRDDGHCRGDPEIIPRKPHKLIWDMPKTCIEAIEKNYEDVKKVISIIDLYSCYNKSFGKGFIKSSGLSPDAFVQMAINLAYFREFGCLHVSMAPASTRLFRRGRVTKISSASTEAKAFVSAMDDKTATNEVRLRYLKEACEVHQLLAKKSMTLQRDNKFIYSLLYAANETNTSSSFIDLAHYHEKYLVASNVPIDQAGTMRLNQYPENGPAGGAAGAVNEDGYAVYYTMSGEKIIYFHVTSVLKNDETDSRRFAHAILKALSDMRVTVDRAV